MTDNQQHAVLLWMNFCAEKYNHAIEPMQKILDDEKTTKEEQIKIAEFLSAFGGGYDAFTKGAPKNK